MKMNETMEAEELIKSNVLQSRVVPAEIAITAVSLARKEERERAFEALEFMLDEWVHGGDAEGILVEFKEKLNHEKPI